MDTERYDYDETGINDRVWLNAVGVIGMIPMNDPGSQTKKIFPKSPYPPREAPRTCPLRAVFADKLLAVSGGVVLAAGLVWYLL